MNVVGKRLRWLRKRSGKTQEQVAKDMNLKNANSVSRYETGERRVEPDTLAKFARYYNTTTDFIIGMTDDPNQEQAETDRNIKKIFEEGELHWDGVPLTKEQLKPIRDLLEVVVRERLPKYLAEKNKKSEEE